LLPAVTSWFVYVLVAVVVAVPAVGEDWVMVTGLTVRAKVHVPVFDKVSKSVPVTLYEPATRGPFVVTAPVVDTKTCVECADVVST
jgi:hypothetical protein